MSGYDLDRFVTAQDPVIDAVLAELRQGRKHGHWMWFVFPQLRGLGRTETARHYGIATLGEARAYLDHPVLGPRLVACASALLAVEGRSALQILGTPDDLKLRSSMTLFAMADPQESVFTAVLAKYCAGSLDPLTVAALGQEGSGRTAERHA